MQFERSNSRSGGSGRDQFRAGSPTTRRRLSRSTSLPPLSVFRFTVAPFLPCFLSPGSAVCFCRSVLPSAPVAPFYPSTLSSLPGGSRCRRQCGPRRRLRGFALVFRDTTATRNTASHVVSGSPRRHRSSSLPFPRRRRSSFLKFLRYVPSVPPCAVCH